MSNAIFDKIANSYILSFTSAKILLVSAPWGITGGIVNTNAEIKRDAQSGDSTWGAEPPAISAAGIEAADKDLAKKEFAERLEKLMLEKGWNQSQLARQSSRHSDRPIGRSNISVYLLGKSLPGRPHLRAMAMALGVKPEFLMPGAVHSAAEAADPAFQLTRIAGRPGTMLIRIHQVLPYKKAIAILRVLETPDEELEG